MADASKSNLEPIEENDIDLAAKFGGKAKNMEMSGGSEIEPEIKEVPASIEKPVERKEGSALASTEKNCGSYPM